MLPFDVLWVGETVDNQARDTVCECSFCALVKLLSRSCNIFRGIETRSPEPYWLCLNGMQNKRERSEPTRDRLPRPRCDEFFPLQ
jgi:hypothetical protein